MGLASLVRWQWKDYDQYHQDRNNLFLHLVAVPLFWLGLVLIGVFAAGAVGWGWAVAGLLLLPVSLALQGAGHKREKKPSVPFSSPGNAMARLVVEQLVTFPRYVVSGRAWGGRSRGA
jgi:hypothetical protein